MTVPIPVEPIFRQGMSLTIGLVGALIAVQIGMPLPWMLGSMLLVMCVATGGAKLATPVRLRNLVIPVLGVMLGSGFHPGLFSHLGDWITAFVVLPFFVAASFAASFTFYRLMGRYDPVTAYFSAAPGGLTDMVIIGTAAGGDERRIALAHACRIFIVINLVALFYGLVLGVETGDEARRYVGFADLPLDDYVILIACAVLGVVIGPRVGLPAPQILGPMILSGFVHLFGISETPPPTMAVNAAQVIMGTAIGARFVGTSPRQVAKDLILGFGSSLCLLSIALASAWATASLTSLPIREVFLAYSPGGIAEMGLLALALGGDIAFIATSHIARITLVIAAAPIVFSYFRNRRL